MAAHAANLAGAEFTIISLGRKSQLHGCQYLHEPVLPDTPSVAVNYQLVGTAADYARKVYGDAALADSRQPLTVSPNVYIGERPAWDLRWTYDRLWERYSSNIFEIALDVDIIKAVIREKNPVVVFSTIPAPLLCEDPGHVFRSTEAWAAGDAPELGRLVPFTCPPNTVECNGDPYTGYSRVSNVFGHSTVEWPGWRETKPPLSGLVKITKPLSTNCQCLSNAPGVGPIRRLGRYGRWEKGILSHHAYADATNYLRAAA